MYNKKVLSTATKNLNKAKAPAKPKDTTIYDQQGQRNHPGKVTTILGDTMATDGYGYIPLMVYPNNGQPPQLVMPNTGPRHFLGATEFTEVPVNEDELDYYDDELTDDEIEELKRGGYIVEDLPTAQIGLIKSPYKMPAGVTHPMQVPAKKPTVKPTRTYDPLTDVKPQVSESTKPINTPTIDKNLADKMIAQKAAQRQATVEAVKAQPTLSQQEKTDILLNNDKLDSYDYLTDLKGPDTVKESTPQSAGSRAWDIITNPFDAFEYAVRTGDISNMPHNYNAMRMAGIDPSAGQGSNLVGNFLNTSYNLFDAGDKVVRNIGEGNYGEALLQGSRFIPGSRVSTGLGSKLYKATAKAPSVPGMPSYGKDLWYSATHGRKIPTYKTATRWQPDAYPESLVQAGKKELTPEQQSLTGSWYGYSPGNKKVNPDASSAVGFYMRTRPGAGNINTLKLSQRQIDELEAAMPDFAKGMSGKTNTQATSTDWVKGELNVPLEVRQKAKTTRFDVNPREYVPTQLDSNIDPTSIYARLKGDIETGTFVNDLIESQYKPIMGIPRKYFPYKKGGSLPNIPKKKNSKGYSRSLMATNKLFAQNPLTKKPKSKKRKIFNPNSKYYQDGGVALPEDYSQFESFAKTLPSNLQDPEYQYGNPDQYNLYGMWETAGKPGSFSDVQDGEYFPLQDDGTYNGFTVGSDGEFLKPMSHGTTWKEVMNAHLNTDPYFKENRLIKNEQGRLQYVPNKEKGGFHTDINKRRQVLTDWTYGKDLGLVQAQEGYENKPAGKFEGEDYYNALTMANRDLQEVKVKPKSEQLSPVSWVRFQREFQNATPYEEFAKERREKYLKRTNKGLNELAGVTEKNFPKAAEDRIKNAYERKMTTYMAKRLADTMGFDPNKRGEWVDALKTGAQQNDPIAQKYLEIFSKSDYQSKLTKPLGARLKSGLQQTANVFLPKDYEFNYDIEGYTPEENKVAKTDWTEPLEIFSFTEAAPQIVLNALDSQGPIAGTEGNFTPDILSGEIKPRLEHMVDYADPSNYMLGYKGALMGLKGLGKAAKYARKTAPIVWSTAKDAAKTTKNFTYDAARATGDWLDTPLLQPKSFKKSQDLYNAQLANSNTWREIAMGNLTPLQSLSRPSMLLKTGTVGTTAYNLPKTFEQNTTNLNILKDESIAPAERINAGSNLLLNNFSMAFGLSPIFGRMGNYMYNSNPSQVTSIASNAKKLYDSDPEGFRTWFNTARLLTALPKKQEGGQTSWEGEYTDEELEQLKQDGYQIEYLD
jgi:hypothetical protein